MPQLSTILSRRNRRPSVKALHKSNLIEVRAQRLKSPTLLWLNLAYLQEHGIHLPAKGLTPALKKQILNSLAYAVPSENSPRSAFDRKKTKIFYADRYGGFGIGLNWGSGRSASAGAFQLKGIGITPLLAANPGHGHSNGAVSLDEGIREAVWGEVNQELPFGGNRVIAIIDKGTKTTDKYGELQRDVLIVRECAIRPAHFLAAEASEAAADKWPITEKERITYNSYLLVEALPHPVDGAPFESTREAAGLLEYTRRVARQYAAAVALKLFHGATSPSNIELSGRFVDYGVQTALSGYGHVQYVPYCAPFGDTKETRDRLVRDFIEGLKGRFPSRIARRLPSSQEAGKLFDRTYRQALATEFLKLTGAPSHLVEALSPAPLASRLGATIHKIATAGAFRGIAKNERPPDRLQKYDIGEILARLADARWPLVLASRSNGSSGPREKRLFQRLSNLYQQFMREIRARAARSHISPAALMEFVRLNVRRRNANRPLLYRWKTMRNNARLAKAYDRDPNAEAIWGAIDKLISESRRVYLDDPAYVVTLKEVRHSKDASSLRYQYDARSGTHRIVLRAPLAASRGISFRGRAIARKKSERAIRVQCGTSPFEEVSVLQRGHRYIEFSHPVPQGSLRERRRIVVGKTAIPKAFEGLIGSR